MQKLLLISLICFGISSALTLNCEQHERESMMCNKMFDPVCAIQSDPNGDSYPIQRTFSNKCMACSEEKTLFVAPGSCDSYPKEAIFCHPNSHLRMVMCPFIHNPVCGVMFSNENFSCDSKYCASTFENACLACTRSAVGYYVPGDCNKQKFLEDNVNY